MEQHTALIAWIVVAPESDTRLQPCCADTNAAESHTDAIARAGMDASGAHSATKGKAWTYL